MAMRTRSKQWDVEKNNNKERYSRGHGRESRQQGGLARDMDAGVGGPCQGCTADATTKISTPTPPQNNACFSGIAEVIEKGGWRNKDDHFIVTELNRQSQMSSNKKQQEERQEKVLQSPGFHPFCL
jgi:hypothetical protein